MLFCENRSHQIDRNAIKRVGGYFGMSGFAILDGRHRQQACDDLGIDAEYITDDELVETAGDPWAYVWSTMMRKNHSESQLSMYAAEWQELLKPAAKERQKKNGGDRKSSGKKIGCGNVATTDSGKSRDEAARRRVTSSNNLTRPVTPFWRTKRCSTKSKSML